jgi:SAM-dependent methyltransferase
LTDPRTLDAYGQHAADVIERDRAVESPLAEFFRIAFPAHARVVDVGAGAGRELQALLRAHYDAYGVEPVQALREAAGALIGDPRRVLAGALPELPLAPGEWDGLVCSAVLQHLPRSRLFDAVMELRSLLKPRGRALIAFPLGSRPGLRDSRDAWGRLFTELQPTELQLLFERVGFTTLARWDRGDALGRPGIRWATFLFEAGEARGVRPLDQLATIISTREKKVATYKLALLRALSDIAMTQPNLATWREDGAVEVPIDAIATRWVQYYWPLLDAPEFLPQQQGDESRGAHRLGFSRELKALIERWRGAGGLAGFMLEQANAPTREAPYGKVLAALRKTIFSGPVTYAGGALSTGPLFSRVGDRVVVPAGIWRELSLLGPWVTDALILRWAELIERLSSRRVTVATALPSLLPVPPGERQTAPVRSIFGEGASRCTWTDRALRPDSLAIDHVLPWSQWHNNDLWNLVPADAAVNRSKSDALPERRFLRARRAAFIDVWETTRSALPTRFDREVGGQLGRAVSSREAVLPELFDVLCESVERTRAQCGLPSWTP